MIQKGVKRVLVPLDGSKSSKAGLEMAIYIARSCGATITGIYCMDVQPRSEFGAGTVTNKKREDSMRRFLEDSKELCARHGIVFKSKIARGDAGYHIVQTAQKKNAGFDIIVMGSRGRGAIKKMFLGSVSNYVIHASKVPVLLVK